MPNSDFIMMIVFIALALFFISTIMRTKDGKKTSDKTEANAAKPQTVGRNQMAEDIKATKTSQIVDAVSILEDLGTANSNYRHYCELVGQSMASSGVVAPYSRRTVAYYDIKCYRIDATYGGGQKETLIAQEHSFDPFFFTDGSCETPVYIDLESFGENVILVNSTNHIEGPNSDFSKRVRQSAAAATGSGATGAYAMVAHAAERGANALLGAASTLREALRPQPLEPAFALAGAGASSSAPAPTSALGSNLMLANHEGRGVTSGRGGGRPQGNPPSRQPQISIHVGYGSQLPGHLGDFMGPSHHPYVMGGPYSTHRPTSTNAGDILLGMSLAALLNSMSASQPTVTTTTTTDTFRGYRLVENIVPLGSPIYCIGEIYRHGTDVYMSRSLAKDYPTSFFATKPESEVLSAIGGI